MNTYTNNMTKTERVAYGLRELYENYGYAQYRMSKFEEYDLYVRNKSFLLSNQIITFTDTDGKLMALKPDVTLSIVKNSPEEECGVRKLYYNENVYRVPKGSFSYKEIMQAGVECIGELDSYSVSEVLTLAAKGLSLISDDFVLDVSDLGIISEVVDSMGLDQAGRERVFTAIGEKNVQGIAAVLNEYGVASEKSDTLCSLVSMNGDAEEMLKILDGASYACEFARIIGVLRERFGDRVRIDFSVVDDMRYYNGIVFKGFIKGIPTSVLSGGRYDSLMSLMGKKSGAIGFAVYLDLLDEFDEDDSEYDCDVFLLYKENTPIGDVAKKADELTLGGKRVRCGMTMPSGVSFKETVEI